MRYGQRLPNSSGQGGTTGSTAKKHLFASFRKQEDSDKRAWMYVICYPTSSEHRKIC